MAKLSKRLFWISQAAVFPAVILAAGLVLTSRSSPAKPDYTKKERKQCTYCHEGSWNSTTFTKAGQYYLEHRTFRGYTPKTEGGDAKKTTGAK